MRPLVAILLFFAASVAVAQTHYDGNIYIGGKGGITLSRTQFNPSVPQTMLLGATAGIAFRYIEERHFGLIAELNFEQRGWKEKFEGYDYQYQRTFSYIQLPILTHIYFGNNRVHGFFNAGPEVGYMIAHSTKSNFDYANISAIEGFPSTNRNIDQFVLPVKSRFDYGISGGLGMEVFTRGRGSFTLEGRFYYGLHDVFSNHKKDTFSGSSGMSVMITLGYMYRIK